MGAAGSLCAPRRAAAGPSAGRVALRLRFNSRSHPTDRAAGHGLGLRANLHLDPLPAALDLHAQLFANRRRLDDRLKLPEAQSTGLPFTLTIRSPPRSPAAAAGVLGADAADHQRIQVRQAYPEEPETTARYQHPGTGGAPGRNQPGPSRCGERVPTAARSIPPAEYRVDLGTRETMPTTSPFRLTSGPPILAGLGRISVSSHSSPGSSGASRAASAEDAR